MRIILYFVLAIADMVAMYAITRHWVKNCKTLRSFVVRYSWLTIVMGYLMYIVTHKIFLASGAVQFASLGFLAGMFKYIKAK